jgi:phosphatidylglycerol:prolipoprotein diacylglycerol transferase
VGLGGRDRSDRTDRTYSPCEAKPAGRRRSLHQSPITNHSITPSPYSLFLLLGIALSAAYWIRASKEDSRLPLIYAAALGGAFLGAKLAYLGAEGWLVAAGDHRWIHWLTGKSVTGALLGGFVAVELVKRIVGYTKPTGDKFALIVPLGIMIGRLGCLTHGCCQGIPCELGPFSTHGPDGAANWPAVPVEILFNLGAFTAVLLLRRAGRFPGQLFHLYLIAYGLFRFGHEFLRATPKPFLGLSGYQIIAALLAVVGIVAYRVRARQKRGG